jgi:GAF domain-containing protein
VSSPSSPQSQEIARLFAGLAAQLQAEHHEQPTLDRIVELALQAIDAADHCAITVRNSDNQVTTPAATDPLAAKVAALEDELDEGPCLDTVWEFDIVTVTDMEHENRWPIWAPAASRLGIRSMLGVRLDITGQPVVASLNLFATRPSAFDPTDIAIAGIYARHASNALAAARYEEGLRAAARSRQIIGVAEGILMQRFGLTLDQSFELLRRYSLTYNVKLRVLADNLVRSGGLSAGGPATSDTPATGLEHALGLEKDTCD